MSRNKPVSQMLSYRPTDGTTTALNQLSLQQLLPLTGSEVLRTYVLAANAPHRVVEQVAALATDRATHLPMYRRSSDIGSPRHVERQPVEGEGKRDQDLRRKKRRNETRPRFNSLLYAKATVPATIITDETES